MISLALIGVTQAVTYQNTGRQTPLERVTRPLTQPSGGNTDVNLAFNYLRPFYMNAEYAVLGMSQGFLQVDLKNPFYCINEGVASVLGAAEMVVRIFAEEEQPLASDIW